MPASTRPRTTPTLLPTPAVPAPAMLLVPPVMLLVRLEMRLVRLGRAPAESPAAVRPTPRPGSSGAPRSRPAGAGRALAGTPPTGPSGATTRLPGSPAGATRPIRIEGPPAHRWQRRGRPSRVPRSQGRRGRGRGRRPLLSPGRGHAQVSSSEPALPSSRARMGTRGSRAPSRRPTGDPNRRSPRIGRVPRRTGGVQHRNHTAGVPRARSSHCPDIGPRRRPRTADRRLQGSRRTDSPLPDSQGRDRPRRDAWYRDSPRQGARYRGSPPPESQGRGRPGQGARRRGVPVPNSRCRDSRPPVGCGPPDRSAVLPVGRRPGTPAGRKRRRGRRAGSSADRCGRPAASTRCSRRTRRLRTRRRSSSGRPSGRRCRQRSSRGRKTRPC